MAATDVGYWGAQTSGMTGLINNEVKLSALAGAARDNPDLAAALGPSIQEHGEELEHIAQRVRMPGEGSLPQISEFMRESRRAIARVSSVLEQNPALNTPQVNAIMGHNKPLQELVGPESRSQIDVIEFVTNYTSSAFRSGKATPEAMGKMSDACADFAWQAISTLKASDLSTGMGRERAAAGLQGNAAHAMRQINTISEALPAEQKNTIMAATNSTATANAMNKPRAQKM